MPHQAPSPSLFRRILRRWKWLAGLALVLLLTVWPLLRYLGEKAAETLKTRLADQGLAVDWKTARLTAEPGIHFTGLELGSLYEQEAGSLLLWDKVTVEKGPDGWSSVRVLNEDGVIHVGDGADRLDLTDVQLDIEASAQRIRSQMLSWETGGLRMEVELDLDLQQLAAGSSAEEARDKAKLSDSGPVNVQATLNAVLREVKTWADFTGGSNRPTLQVSALTVKDSPGLLVTASLLGKSIYWRGVPLSGIALDLEWASGPPASPLFIRRLSMNPDSTSDKVDASLNLETQVLDIRAFDVQLDLFQLTRATLPKESRAGLDMLKTTGLIRLQASGQAPLAAFEKAALQGRIDGPDRLVVDLGEGRSIPVEKPGGDWSLRGNSVTITGHTAGLWGGQVSTKSMHIDWSEAPRFEGDSTITGVDTPAMMTSLGQSSVLPGKLSTTFQGGGGLALDQITGSGTVSVKNAAFYRVPLLGPLSVVFDKIAPGFARDTASDLDAQFSITRGIVTLHKAALQSKLTEVTAEGKVDLVQQRGDLVGKAKLRGIVGLPTVLLSELLAVEGSGPLNDMRWSLKNAPGMAEITGAVGKAGGAVTDVVKDVGGAAGKATGTAVKEAGKAAKKIFSLPGKLLPGGGKKEE